MSGAETDTATVAEALELNGYPDEDTQPCPVAALSRLSGRVTELEQELRDTWNLLAEDSIDLEFVRKRIYDTLAKEDGSGGEAERYPFNHYCGCGGYVEAGETFYTRYCCTTHLYAALAGSAGQEQA